MATTKRRGPRSLPRGRASAVAVRVDPARRRRFADLMRTMRHARREEAEGFDAYWEAIAEIMDDELFVAGGFDSADAFLAAEVRLPRRTAYRMIRVARYASPNDEKRWGTALLDAALSFIEARTGGPIRGKLPVRLEALRISVRRGRITKKLPLSEVTVDEVRLAQRDLARRDPKKRPRPSPAEQAIASALAAVRALEGISVAVRGGKLHLAEIPLAQLSTLGRALGALRLPPADPKS